MYDLYKVKSCLNTKYIGQTIIQYDELQSTALKAKAIFDKCPNGTVILSENQSKSKIRFGRVWSSFPDKNIYLSIILKPVLKGFIMPRFEAVASACVCESVNTILNNIECKTKWPNDILINDKKISSINYEIINKKNSMEGIILSIYINVNADSDFDGELKGIATSIKMETNFLVDREMLISYLLNNFETYYDELINYDNVSKSIKVCVKKSALIGKNILLSSIKKKSCKKVLVAGIDSDGCLFVTNEKGNEEIINSGEVTIKYEGNA